MITGQIKTQEINIILDLFLTIINQKFNQIHHLKLVTCVHSPTKMCYPSKYWPPVGRIDSVHGDRNLVCTCLPVEAYAS